VNVFLVYFSRNYSFENKVKPSSVAGAATTHTLSSSPSPQHYQMIERHKL